MSHYCIISIINNKLYIYICFMMFFLDFEMTHGDILEPGRFDGCPEPGSSVSGCFFFLRISERLVCREMRTNAKRRGAFFLMFFFLKMVNCMILF